MKPRASFLISAAEPKQFPPADLPEVAFVGRSNAGKSSLINALCGESNLARTSRAPGRTQLLNWFRVEPKVGDPLYFVDLPGYGYAEVPVAMREAWRPLIESYLGDRPTLRAVVLLVDIRRGVGEEEQDFVAWLAERQIALVACLTKGDKLSKSHRTPAAATAQRALGSKRAPIVTAAHEGLGIDELWRQISMAARPA